MNNWDCTEPSPCVIFADQLIKMRKNSIILLLFYCSIFFSSCDTSTPEKYFDVAVLNSNRVVGFAGSSLSRQLETPSVKADASGNVVPQKRREVIEDGIRFSEEMLDKLEGFGKTSDAGDIVNSSIALYNFMLPVYKKEYMELAKLYDENAPAEKIRALDKSIRDQYASGFETLYDDLISKGKVYAAKHNILVNWAN